MSGTNTDIVANLQRVQSNIAAACARAGRDVSDVTLVAVSKTHPASEVLEAVAAGAHHFGENRVEEAEEKIPQVNRASPNTLTWHMIGHVQSRKARLIPPLFQLVHSLDSVKLADKFSRLMLEHQGTLDVLLEINVSGEASKSGMLAVGWSKNPPVYDQIVSDIRQILDLPGLKVRGLMTMAPIVADAEQARPVFADLVALRAALASDLNIALPELSMGMTDDYPVAIEEGATIVRIGRAIFGPRRQ